ncbi:GNAT family N-acetyltransferase [Niabella sp.]|uniref:GNAT family N-acetyltransferase n=1 Tax=Niabella sp. TaxID=1962976 RepID=UPI002621690B|nr:GNAT family N-acetyltransferase [Niabella sp.]
MEFEYLFSLPDKASFFKLFETTHWNKGYKRNEGELYTAIQNSWCTVSVYTDGRLVGFGRVISDGVLHALIVDLIVAPEYQLNGIGKTILRIMVSELKLAGINDILLFSAKGKKDFYKKNGFTERAIDAPGMEYDNK